MLERYKTVLGEVVAETVEKKSKFIATVAHVETEEEAVLWVASMKKKYYNATHNVFAYQVGIKNEVARYSDDGEPSGTAGIPVLTILRELGLKNTAINVTRYFGGVKLGTGGLVRAYSCAAKEGVFLAQISEHVLYETINVIVTYNLSGKLEHYFSQNNFITRETIYTENVEFVLLVEFEIAKTIDKHLQDLTNGTAIIVHGKIVYAYFTNNKLETYEEML